MKDRMVFLERHGADSTLANAVLSAPAFLSGLTEVELAFVRSKLEQRALPPEVVEAKVAVAKALGEVEVGWEQLRPVGCPVGRAQEPAFISRAPRA
jgi:hypothetical protein